MEKPYGCPFDLSPCGGFRAEKAKVRDRFLPPETEKRMIAGISKSIVKELDRILCKSIRYE